MGTPFLSLHFPSGLKLYVKFNINIPFGVEVLAVAASELSGKSSKDIV